MTVITLVAGLPGVGKTTWIQQQLKTIVDPAVYLSLGSGAVPVDGIYLTSEFPRLTVLSEQQLTEFLERWVAGCSVYIELGFHLDLNSLILPVEMNDCRRVAIVSSRTPQSEWHDWAEVIVTGAETDISLQAPHLWRSVLTGEVLDPASLNTFWYELSNGAYGNVQRAKGIFDLADGRAFYFNFVDGLPDSQYLEMNLPRWLNLRPDRFSGIEVVGETLDQIAIAQTLKDCCLDDQAIAYYQQQIQDLPGQEEEEVA